MKCPDCLSPLNHHVYTTFEYYYCANCKAEKDPNASLIACESATGQDADLPIEARRMIKKFGKKLAKTLNNFPDLQDFFQPQDS